MQRIAIHVDTPQPQRLQQVARQLDQGALVALPTDSCYALACHIGDKAALDRIRAIRRIDERHHMTLMCRDLSEIAQYAQVDNQQYRLLKLATPGAYTFILTATKELPRRILHPKRKTLGLRIPDHRVTLSLLAQLDAPLLSCTLALPGETEPLEDADAVADKLSGQLDILIDTGESGHEPTTVIDLTANVPQVVRVGRGDTTRLGLVD